MLHVSNDENNGGPTSIYVALQLNTHRLQRRQRIVKNTLFPVQHFTIAVIGNPLSISYYHDISTS